MRSIGVEGRSASPDPRKRKWEPYLERRSHKRLLWSVLWQESYRQKSAEVENLGLATKGKDGRLVEQEMPVSSSGPKTPTGELVAGRVAETSPGDLASVKFIV